MEKSKKEKKPQNKKTKHSLEHRPLQFLRKSLEGKDHCLARLSRL